MLHNVINHYILTCGSICGAVQLVYKFFAVQCGMRTELSGAVQFADKNFVHRTISNVHQLVASNFAKNRENFKGKICLNVTIPFSVIACCLNVIRDVSKTYSE